MLFRSDALYESVSRQAASARGRLTAVYITSLLISGASLVTGMVLVVIAFRIIGRYVIAPIRASMDTLQDSARRISGVVDEVRKRTRTSSTSVGKLSGLTDSLSAALEEIAGSAAVINTSAAGTQEDAREMTEECTSITAYSVEMRERAKGMEQIGRTSCRERGWLMV